VSLGQNSVPILLMDVIGKITLKSYACPLSVALMKRRVHVSPGSQNPHRRTPEPVDFLLIFPSSVFFFCVVKQVRSPVTEDLAITLFLL